MTQVVPLPWAKPPITGNRTRGNPYARANEVRTAKAEAQEAVRDADPTPMPGANIVLHFRPATKHRRDADGMFPTLKVVQDALVAEHILHDDSWVCVPSSTCRIHPPTPADGPSMWVELTDLDEEQP